MSTMVAMVHPVNKTWTDKKSMYFHTAKYQNYNILSQSSIFSLDDKCRLYLYRILYHSCFSNLNYKFKRFNCFTKTLISKLVIYV